MGCKLRGMSVNASVIERAIRGAGGLKAVAAKCGVSRQAIDKWFVSGVPPKRVIFVERISGVPRHELRPDIYPPEESLLMTRRKRA